MLKEKHVCGKKACYFCGEVDSVSKKCHLCFMQLPKEDKSYTYMAFLDVQLSGSCVIHCKKCYEGKNSCKYCKTNTKEEALLCTFMYEKENNRETFDMYSFFSDKIVHDFDGYSQIYLPKSISATYDTPNNKTSFAQRKHKQNFSKYTFFDGSVLGNYFLFLTHKKIKNYTIIVNDFPHNILAYLAKSLFKYGIPLQIIGSPTIFCLIVTQLGVRFINAECYLDTSFKQQQKSSPFKSLFFPKNWRDKKYLNKFCKKPMIVDLYDFDDTEEDYSIKTEFLAHQESTWDFGKKLQTFSEHCVKVTAFHCINFLKHALHCQLMMIDFSRKECLPVHPFNPPLCTRAAYAFKLLCILSPEIKKLRIVLPPIAMQSSAGELEYCSYMVSKSSCKTYNFAWSQEGQKSFKECVPDLVIKNECHFWNGCVVHGHNVNQCLMHRTPKTAKKRQKNMFGEYLEDAFNNYEKKKKRLLLNHPELEIKEMWQCEWQETRKTDRDVKFFLENVYKRPPLYRLNARASGMFIKIKK